MPATRTVDADVPTGAVTEALENGAYPVVREYAADAARGEPRAFSAPASLGHAVLSRGVAEQVGLAPPAARQTPRARRAHRLAVRCELAAAVRALRMRDLRRGSEPPEGRAPAASLLDDDLADRPLTGHLTAVAPPNRFTDIWRGSAA